MSNWSTSLLANPDHVSRFRLPQSTGHSLLYLFKDLCIGPAAIKISGTVSITGCEKKEWFREIVKRLSIVMAIHLLGKQEAWRPLIPFIANNIYLILKEDVNNRISSRSPEVCEIFRIDVKYFTKLPCIPPGTKECKTQVRHTMELETFDNKTITNDYTVKVECHTQDYRKLGDLVRNGFVGLEPVDGQWDRACFNAMPQFNSRIHPDLIFEHFMKNNKSMRKLLEMKIKSNPEFRYLDFCACVTVSSRRKLINSVLYD